MHVELYVQDLYSRNNIL